MLIKNAHQTFYTFLYLITGVLILDIVFYLIVAPILYDYPYWVYWHYGVNQNKLLFLSVGFLIVTCILLRSPNKSFLNMIYNKTKLFGTTVGSFICIIIILLTINFIY